MKKFFLIIFLHILFFPTLSFSQEKIVFIDMTFILNNSLAGKDLKLKLKDKTNKLENEIKSYKEDIESKKTKIFTQKNVLSEDEYNKKIKEVELEIKKINNLVSKEDKNLKKYKNEIEKEYFKNLNSIIQNYSIENSIGIILNRKDLLMAKSSLNITDEIIDLFNQKIKKINIE